MLRSATPKEDIRALASDMKYMLEHAVICACGNEQVLVQNENFKHLEDVLSKEL